MLLRLRLDEEERRINKEVLYGKDKNFMAYWG